MDGADFQPMSIGQIFDRTFKIYKNNFLRLIVIVAIIQVPISLMTTVFSSVFVAETISYKNDRQKPSHMVVSKSRSGDIESTRTIISPRRSRSSIIIGLVALGGLIITALLSIVAFQLCQGALIRNVSEYYLGNQITVGEAYRFVFPKIFYIIAAAILIGLCVFIGIILLVVPGVIFGLWFSLTIPVIVIENLDPVSAMSRSRKLVAGNLGKVFGISLLLLIINWIITIPFTGVAKLLSSLVFTSHVYLGIFTEQLFNMVAGIFVMPISSIAFILLYYDLRIRKEGFDLEILARNMELQTDDS